eukprot:TRINITY_DN9783_c0_g1_i1.p1 TRINITY_DN9783_c0_g1~~TRINITY_DN9783_c0_g1_i1.p1  ORF type:complete len:1003 (+),score=133.31 TRINITY_DN9783_c0_g1_i1:24-3011(+)
MSEAEVALKVNELHNPSTVANANQWLSNFQRHAQALEICHKILTNPVHSQEVLYFAAQTYCANIQAGAYNTYSPEVCKDNTIALIAQFNSGPVIILRQLCIALCALVLQLGEWQDPVETVIAKFAPANLKASLLEVLTLLPEELASQRIVAKQERRAIVAHYMLTKALPKVFEVITLLLPEPPLQTQVLRCFQAWINGQWGVMALPTDPFTHPILGGLKDNPLFHRTLESLDSPNSDLARVAADALSEVFGLTDELCEVTQPILLMAVQGLNRLGQALRSTEIVGNAAAIDRAKVFCRLISEFAEIHLPNLLYDPETQQKHGVSLTELLENAIYFVQVPNIEVAEAALDFWYNLLSHHLCTPEQVAAELGPPDEDAQAKAERIEEANKRRQQERCVLVPIYERAVKSLCAAIRYPPVPEDAVDFNLEEFLHMRDQFAISLTECCVVVGHAFVLEFVGNHLSSIAQATQSGGNFPWHEVEGDIFVLTTVAPRAPAGGDNVIPPMIALLPTLPYPSSGYAANLLRGTAARLIHFTAGYLGSRGPECLSLFKFLAEQILPFVVQSATDSELRFATETQVVGSIFILVAEGGKVLVPMGEEVWTEVMTHLSRWIHNASLRIENRVNMVMAAGAVLSALPWDKMESSLQLLVRPLAEAVQQMLAAGQRVTEQTLAPFKLFFVALQAVRPRSPLPQGQTHPLISCLSTNWSIVEQAFKQTHDVELVMQEACHGITSVIALTREQSAPVLQPFLGILVECFKRAPMIFHLGAVRTVVGVFGGASDPTVLGLLSGVLEHLHAYVEGKMQDRTFLVQQPDIVGMYYDTLACGLQPPPLATTILNSSWVARAIHLGSETLPICNHPKALCAVLLFYQRLFLWLMRPGTPPAQKAMELLGQSLNQVANALMQCLAVHSHGVQHAVPLLASCIQPIAAIPGGAQALQQALHSVPSQFMTAMQKEAFLQLCVNEKDPRQYGMRLHLVAQECQQEFKRSQFATASGESR